MRERRKNRNRVPQEDSTHCKKSQEALGEGVRGNEAIKFE